MSINLNGLRILNTRPLPQGKVLSQSIVAAGGICIELPGLAIEPTPVSWSNLADLAQINHAVFISSNAVNYFFKALNIKQIAWPHTIEVTAIGNASAAALLALGIPVDNIPTIADSEHLLQLQALQQVQNHKLLLIKGEGGRAIISDTLRSRGAEIISVSVYRRVLPYTPKEYVNSLWQDDDVDIILFTSQQAMHNIFTLFGENARQWLCNKPCIVISKRLADEASSYGMKTILISSYDTILSSLHHYYQGLIYDH